MALVTYSRLGINARRLYWDIISHPNIQALWPMNEASGDILDRCVRNRLTGVAQGSGGTYGASLGNGFVGISLAASRIFQLGAVGPLNFERTDAFGGVTTALEPRSERGMNGGAGHEWCAVFGRVVTEDVAKGGLGFTSLSC